jgi:hypothetical protein
LAEPANQGAHGQPQNPTLAADKPISTESRLSSSARSRYRPLHGKLVPIG